MMTYDRNVVRMNESMWRADVGALYEAAKRRAGENETAVEMGEGAGAVAIRMGGGGSAGGLQYGM